MKVMLYRDGRPGVVTRLPEEDPMADIAELLGGEVELTPLNRRLSLVVRKDTTGLPERYEIHRMDKAPEPVAGDCVVVARLPNLMLGTMGPEDIKRAGEFVHVRG